MYARGMSVRDIRGYLEELYGLEVSPDLISRVTDAVLDEVKEWRSRALDAVYPVVIFDALRVKIRDKDSRIVKNKAVYLALGITAEGQREVLGLWIADSGRGQDLIQWIKSPDHGAKFWLGIMNELRNRGVADILIAVVDGLKGAPPVLASNRPPDGLPPAADRRELPKRSRRPFRRPRCKPASSIWFVIRWRSAHGRITSRSPPTSRPSMVPRTPMPPAKPWKLSTPNGAINTRPSPRPGAGLGRR